jgi:hypothetical protein
MDLSALPDDIRESLEDLRDDQGLTMSMRSVVQSFKEGKTERGDAIEELLELISKSVDEENRLPKQAYYFEARKVLGCPISRQEKRYLLKRFEKMKESARIEALRKNDPKQADGLQQIINERDKSH